MVNLVVGAHNKGKCGYEVKQRYHRLINIKVKKGLIYWTLIQVKKGYGVVNLVVGAHNKGGTYYIAQYLCTQAMCKCEAGDFSG